MMEQQVSAISGYILKKLADHAVLKVTETLKRRNGKLLTDAQAVETALDFHMRNIKNWCSNISFADLRAPKSIAKVFVPLDVFLQPLRRRVSADEPVQAISLEDALANTVENDMLSPSAQSTPRHLLILGQPGAGKSTSMKHVCHRLLYEEDFLKDRIELPLLLRLRDLNSTSRSSHGPDEFLDEDAMIAELQSLMGLRIEYPPDLNGDENRSARRSLRDRIVTDFLDSIKALIILDGFDEIVASSRKEAVVSRLRMLTRQLEKSSIILTSRSGEFNYHIENMAQFEIKPLSSAQVLSFTSRWLGETNGQDLVNQIESSPYNDTAIRPLTIAHLCAIYERVGRIPDKPKTVYKKIISLLLEEWDEQRSIRRNSAYSNFEVDRKSEFLANLAYVLTLSATGVRYSKRDLISAYEKIHGNFDLPLKEAAKVANELESHTGLFVQSGYDFFEFSHKSLQEYLAADFIVKLPSIPEEPRQLARLANELAIATAISSQPSLYFSHLIFERLATMRPSFGFIRTFVSRLLLESPDFERNSAAGASLLALYSQYLQLAQDATNQLSLFVLDQLKGEFSTLGALIKDRVSADDLLQLYMIAGRSAGFTGHPTLDGEEILVLGRKGGSHAAGTHRKAQLSLRRLPDEIWIRSSLLADGDRAKVIS